MGEWSVDRDGKRWVVATDPGSGEITMSITPPGPFQMDVNTAEEMRRLFAAAIGSARKQP